MSKQKKYWLVKSEPFKYSWETFLKDGSAVWDGVRNYGARNNLREMKKGDEVFFYHSNEGLEIVGIAKVKREHFQDPTTDEPAWLAVELEPYAALDEPISLKLLKEDAVLSQMQLVKLSRLSVSIVREEEAERLKKWGKVKRLSLK